MPLFILGSGEKLWIRNINRGLQHRDGIKAMGLDKHPGGRTKKGRRERQGITERRRGRENWAWALSLELVKRKRESRKEKWKRGSW